MAHFPTMHAFPRPYRLRRSRIGSVLAIIDWKLRTHIYTHTHDQRTARTEYGSVSLASRFHPIAHDSFRPGIEPNWNLFTARACNIIRRRVWFSGIGSSNYLTTPSVYPSQANHTSPPETMGNAPNPKQYTKYSKNTAEVRVKKCIPVQRGMFRLGTGNLFYLILIKIFTILNNIVNKCL